MREPRDREVVTDCLGGLYSIAGAAKRLGMKYTCLEKRVNRGQVPCVRVGNERFVSLADVKLSEPPAGRGRPRREIEYDQYQPA